MSAFTGWQPHDYPAGDAPFRVAETGGPQPFFHDELDKLRSSWRTPHQSDYPDGYLGTINPRRQDRLLQGLKQRTTAKPYSRGIHKGERRDPSDYQWPQEFNLWSGIEYEAQGYKYVSPGLSMDQMPGVMTNDGKPSPADFVPKVRGLPSRNGVVEWNADDPARSAALRRLAPPWAARTPDMSVPYPGRS